MNTGWSASILPYLDQPALFNALNFSLVYDDPSKLHCRHTPFSMSISVPPNRGSRSGIAIRRDVFDHADADYGGMYGPRGLGDPAFTNNPPRGPMIFNRRSPSRESPTAPRRRSLSVRIPRRSTRCGRAATTSSTRPPDQRTPPTEYGEELTSQHPGGRQRPVRRRLGPFPQEPDQRKVLAGTLHPERRRGYIG